MRQRQKQYRELIFSMKKSRIGFTLKYVIIACIFLLAVNVVSSVLIMNRSKKEMTEHMHMRMLDISYAATAAIDGDVLEGITAEDAELKTENYLDIYNKLSVFLNITELTYIYTVKESVDEETGERIYVFTIDTDPEEPAEYGEEIVYTEALEAAGKGTSSVDKTASEDRWGRYYSSYCPVYNSKHEIVGILGIDYSAAWYENQLKNNSFSHLLSSGVSLLVGCVLIILLTAQLRKKLNDLCDEAFSLAKNVMSLTEEITSSAEEYKGAVKESEEDEGSSLSLTEEESEEDGKKKSSVDAIEGLALKIRSMQEEMKKYNYFVQSRAYTDTMTGVGNKTAYFDTVRNLNKKIAEGEAKFVVTFCDINGLKTINDNYGHESGDIFISEAANVLKRVFDAKNIYRIGGDEFIVILENVDKEEMNDLMNKLDRELASFNEKERRYDGKLSFSYGIGVFMPDQDTEFRQVFKRADESMYKSKGLFYRKYGSIFRRRNSDSLD